jgi:hypothetical protein
VVKPPPPLPITRAHSVGLAPNADGENVLVFGTMLGHQIACLSPVGLKEMLAACSPGVLSCK